MLKVFLTREAAEAYIKVHRPSRDVEPKEIEVLEAGEPKRVWALHVAGSRYLDEAGGFAEVEG
jgi:hypothetical protein